MSSNQISPKYVVTIAGIKEALKQGWRLHVVSQQLPEFGSNYHLNGSWYLAIVHPETGEWAVLVTTKEYARKSSRTRIKEVAKVEGEYVFREIKTLSGLSSVLLELGFSFIGYPTIPGTSVILEE